MKIDKVYIVVEVKIDGAFKLIEMFLDSTDAYQKICEMVEGKDFEEAQNEDDHTVWHNKEVMLMIRECPTNDLDQPL